MPRHSAPQQPSWLRPRLVVAFVVATAGLVTAIWLPTRNDSAEAAERDRGRDADSRRSQALTAFSDGFSGRRGSTVDPAKWGLRTDSARGGPRFSESVRHARLDGEGNLVIVARDGERGRTPTSARLFTRTALQGAAGHLEAEIRAPRGDGLQPAFELVPADQQEAGVLNLLADPVDDDEFHTYALDWTPGEVSLSVDGEPVTRRTLEGVDTTQPFRLALSLTVSDRERADLPARMVVDSVEYTATDVSPSPSESPTSEPPATEPPATEPPASEPPATEPPATEPTPPPAPDPTTAPPTTEPTPAPPAAKPWKAFTNYATEQLVTFRGVEYRVLEAHTSLPGWTPPALPALFEKS